MDLDNMVSEVSKGATQAIQGVNSSVNLSLISNPEKMLANQFQLFQYATYLTYGSTLLKTYKDLIGGIIAKI
ncbi:type III secretion system needle filament subunit SctF [unidentified bacterial endosymbiont]|uniref:type III secretion system needle filament subunit SctF n=1 Tax=unidentified bacterial endosymbiont TaxID=2355 RepID=UPI00209F3F4D|nr:type III secretion system needle filament subunit SctF [unidentified bacterial endosymbiont]